MDAPDFINGVGFENPKHSVGAEIPLRLEIGIGKIKVPQVFLVFTDPFPTVSGNHTGTISLGIATDNFFS